MPIDPTPGYFKGPEPPLIDGVPRWRNRHRGKPGAYKRLPKPKRSQEVIRESKRHAYEAKLARILQEWEEWKAANPE